MKTYKIILVALCSLSLNACSGTFEGLKQDFSTFGKTVDDKVSNLKQSDENTEKNNATAILSDGTCPPLNVDPQFSKMSEFYDPEKPSKGTEVSTLNLISTKSACEKDGDYLSVQIELAFEGALGPKAKRKSGDRPFFAYPYFVGVTNNDGDELAKELFAASVTYGANQEKIKLVETIRQRLPLNDDGTTPAYQIKIGFQLTEEQLFYNASH